MARNSISSMRNKTANTKSKKQEEKPMKKHVIQDSDSDSEDDSDFETIGSDDTETDLDDDEEDEEDDEDDFITDDDENEIEEEDSEDEIPKLIRTRRSKRIQRKSKNNEDENGDNDDDTEHDKNEDEKRKTKVPLESPKNISSSQIEKEMKNRGEFLKILQGIFPSKYMNEKVKNHEKLTETNETEDDTKSQQKEKSSATEKKKNKETKEDKKGKKEKKAKDVKRKTRVHDDDDNEDEDDDSDDEDYVPPTKSPKNDKYINILFALDDDDDDEFYDDDEEDLACLEEDENEPCDSDDEETFMKESYEKIEVPESSDKSDYEDANANDSNKKDKDNDKDNKSKNIDTISNVYGKKANKKDKKSKNDTKESEEPDVENEYKELVELKKHFMEKLKKNPKSKISLKGIKDCDESIKKLVKKSRIENTKKYHSLVKGKREDEINELEYFKKKLSNKEQLRIMKELEEINKHSIVDKPYRLALISSDIPNKYKATIMHKLNLMKNIMPSDNEYFKLRNWMDTFMKIPFGKYKSLSVKIEDGIEVCHQFMENAMKQLNECVYGLNDAKMQVMQMVGQWISNPNAMGTAIAIHGPAGTGKTSIVKDGISKILGREFAFISLGGASDSSFLEGHSYTYEGSTWGKIVQILIDSKCMNPVIYFDELDKLSETPKGEEIANLLVHLTDTTQNNQFHDKYFSEVSFDISKCLFIFSYNDESKVSPILRDRMYKIQTKGYDTKEKLIIARKYMLPKIREQVNFKEEDIVIPDDTLQYIISNDKFSKNEKGVRNLKRCLEVIHTKLNLFRLMRHDDNIFSKEMNIKVEFPFVVSKEHVDLLVKVDESMNHSLLAMYV